MHIGANPDTCLHRVVYVAITTDLDHISMCLSCDSELSPEYRNGRVYEYSVGHNLWFELCGKRLKEYLAARDGGIEEVVGQLWDDERARTIDYSGVERTQA